MGWEAVLGIIRCALPGLIAEVDSAEGIEHSSTGLACDWLIVDQRHILDLLQRCVKAANRDDDTCSGHFVAWEIVPREAHSIAHFSIVKLFHILVIFLTVCLIMIRKVLSFLFKSLI